VEWLGDGKEMATEKTSRSSKSSVAVDGTRGFCKLARARFRNVSYQASQERNL